MKRLHDFEPDGVRQQSAPRGQEHPPAAEFRQAILRELLRQLVHFGPRRIRAALAPKREIHPCGHPQAKNQRILGQLPHSQSDPVLRHSLAVIQPDVPLLEVGDVGSAPAAVL